jgi:hypothetical protein
MMMKETLTLTLLLGMVIPLAASADDSRVRFEGGIGVNPVKAGPAANAITRDGVTVPPGGVPWVIRSLSADVKGDGQVSVNGRGLLVAGGPSIGTTLGQSVKAMLFCAGQPPSLSAVTPLDPDGDFRIDGPLTPTPPAPCTNPVLLIVSAGGNWFAAGIPKQ